MPAAPQDRRWTLIAVCATTFMLLVDITIVNVALPSIQRELDASLTGLQWVVDAYAITLAALILTAGALADRYGRRLIFAIGVALFTVASLLCGVAWNIGSLDVARALQGVGGAALFATALALIGAEYQGRERAGAIAIWGSVIGVAVASGPLAGGIITEWLSWRWVFFVNVPIGVAVFVIALMKVRESRDPRADRTDYAGLVLFSASLFLIVFGLLRGNGEGWGSGQIVGSLVVGAALLVIFVLVERRQARPMLDVSLFRVPAFVGVQLATFCIGAGMFALFPFLSIYIQDILGYSPLKAGLGFLPFTVFVFAVPLATRNLATTKPMWLLLAVAMALVAVGLVLLEIVSPTSGYGALLPGFIVAGIGTGLANPTIAGAALRVVDPARTGMAAGISNTARITGLAVGVAVLGAILQSRIGSSLRDVGFHGSSLSAAVASSGERAAHGDARLLGAIPTAFVSGLDTIVLIGAALLVVGALAALFLVRRAEAPAAAPEAEPAAETS
ncbi:MAG TPA: MFS transporter [Gaiellaceae bacterium]|nr:MFS transporter [Gaiellaceae bacterium]